MTIATNLKKARESAGFTLAMAARVSNVPASTISNVEKGGKIKLCDAYLLANAYGVQINDFLEGVPLDV